MSLSGKSSAMSPEKQRVAPMRVDAISVLNKLEANCLNLKFLKCLESRRMNRKVYIANPIVNPIENHCIPSFGARNIVTEAMMLNENTFISIGVMVFFIA